MPFTATARRSWRSPRTNLEWIVKLAPWNGRDGGLGVFVGGYIVFDGQGGKQGATAPSVEVKAVADDSQVIRRARGRAAPGQSRRRARRASARGAGRRRDATEPRGDADRRGARGAEHH